jgi:hypothetical protein
MQATTRGWYPEDDNDHVIRFWTGNEWKGVRTWDGEAWVERDEPIEPKRPVELVPPPPASNGATPQVDVQAIAENAARAASEHVNALIESIKAGARPSATFYILGGGALAALLGTQLPWATVSEMGLTENLGPTGGGKLLLATFAIVVAFMGVSTFTGTPSRKSCIAMTVAASAMTFFTLIAYPALHDKAQGLHMEPGLGLMLYFAGNAAIAVGVIRAWMSRRKNVSNV